MPTTLANTHVGQRILREFKKSRAITTCTVSTKHEMSQRVVNSIDNLCKIELNVNDEDRQVDQLDFVASASVTQSIAHSGTPVDVTPADAPTDSMHSLVCNSDKGNFVFHLI